MAIYAQKETGKNRYAWSALALLSGNEFVIVTDESRDLNMSTIFPDVDEFIIFI